MDKVTPTRTCAACTHRLAETLILNTEDGQPYDPPLPLCFDCLRDRPGLRFFQVLTGARRAPKDLSLRRTEAAQELRGQGLTYYAIGDRFGVGHVSVQRWLKPEMAERQLKAGRDWYATSPLAEGKRERQRAYKEAHPLFMTWIAMRHRCYCVTAQGYPDYGGRGITMHPTWENNFAAFEEWINANLGPRPEAHTLDRIDNDGNYEPVNVQWGDRKQQQRNRRPLVRHAEANKLRAQLRAAGIEPCV